MILFGYQRHITGQSSACQKKLGSTKVRAEVELNTLCDAFRGEIRNAFLWLINKITGNIQSRFFHVLEERSFIVRIT